MTYSEPKTPFTHSSTTSSARSTPKSSSTAHHISSINNSGKSSSKWAKFQEKFHSYSSSKSTHQSIHHSPSTNTSFSHSVPHINTSFTPSGNSSFESPQDYLKNLSLDESTISPILNLPGGTTPVSSSSTLHSAFTIPPNRTTSLPKSDLIGTPPPPPTQRPSPNSSFATPPKVKPFIYSKSSSTSNTPRNKKSLVNEKCCFCEELLSSKFSTGEKVIELNCGDTCHEECLWSLINATADDNDDESNTKTSDPNKIFPDCESCGKLAIPLDDTITDSIISKILLSTPPKLRQVSNSSSSDSLIISSNFQSQMLSPRSRPPSSAVTSAKNHKYQSLSLSNRNQKDLSIQIPTSKSLRNHQSNSSRHKSTSRGSSISAMSSIISSVSRSPSPTKTMGRITTNDTLTLSENGKLNKIPLAMLRSEYICHLIKNLQSNYDTNLKESEIDSFGYLRLVDNLLISQNGEVFKNYNVYLFQYNLLLVDLNYSNIEVFKLLKTPKISTPTSTILKINVVSKSNDESCSLYLSQKYNKILQKWIAGLCDYEFIFNSDNLSSTITLPEESSKLDQQSNWEPIAPHTIQSNQHGNDPNQMTIPVLLSPIKLEGKSTASTPITPTKSFFQKTSHLIIIIDHEKSINNQNVIITLTNIIKALSLKFKSLNVICSSSQFENAYCMTSSSLSIDGLSSKIGKINNDSGKNVNQCIEEIIDGAENTEDFNTLIISNNLTKNSLSSIILANQLIIQIQSYNSAKLSPRDNLIKLDTWDKIMEMLVTRYELSFDDDSDSDYDDNSENDANSSDSDFDSDFEQSDDDDNDNDSINSDLFEEKYKNYNDQDEINDNNNDDEDELPSLNSNDELVSNNSSDAQHLSPVSSENNDKTNEFNNNENRTALKTHNSRWSTLFKDIDDALLETTTSLSNMQ